MYRAIVQALPTPSPPPPLLATPVTQAWDAGNALYAYLASGSSWVNRGTSSTAGVQTFTGAAAVHAGSLYLTPSSGLCIPGVSLGETSSVPVTSARPPTPNETAIHETTLCHLLRRLRGRGCWARKLSHAVLRPHHHPQCRHGFT